MDTAHAPSVFDVAAILITLAAALSWLNHKLFKLPSTVGLALMGAVASLIVIGIDWATPSFPIGDSIRAFLAGIDFEATLMEGMLSFLLFAGAMHVDLADLKRHWMPVGILSTVGVLVSTVIIGYAFQIITQLAGLELPLIWCLVFGALISPTDPVAVMGAMKSGGTPPGLQATISEKVVSTMALASSSSASSSRRRSAERISLPATQRGCSLWKPAEAR